jgi:SNF2 family DNA or RNA helicase
VLPARGRPRHHAHPRLNVAFLELDWTPARLEQAEDRCHRIGQRSAVTAWYLLAPETIDSLLEAVIEAKREVIGAVTDGRTDAERTVVDAVVQRLRDEDELARVA